MTALLIGSMPAIVSLNPASESRLRHIVLGVAVGREPDRVAGVVTGDMIPRRCSSNHDRYSPQYLRYKGPATRVRARWMAGNLQEKAPPCIVALSWTAIGVAAEEPPAAAATEG